MHLITAKQPAARPDQRDRGPLLLRAAVREGQERYFDRCQDRVPGFISRHMSLRGAASRYYPPHPIEIARLALSVGLTPLIALAQLILWATGRSRNAAWLAFKSRVQALAVPRAHTQLASAVQSEIFGMPLSSPAQPARELEECVISSPAFSEYLHLVLSEKHEHLSDERIDELAHEVTTALKAGTPGRGTVSGDHREFVQRTRELIAESGIHRDLEGIIAGEAARSDMLNTILTGVVAKVTLGQLKFGAYGIALIIAPTMYFRWSSGREEKIRRTIDGILPDGPFSLSRLGWNFEWTDSFESVALMVGLFLGLSALLSVIGYLIAPILAPAWRRTGLPTMSLRRAIEASRARVTGGGQRQTLAPEVFAAKLGDLAEMFSRTG